MFFNLQWLMQFPRRLCTQTIIIIKMAKEKANTSSIPVHTQILQLNKTVVASSKMPPENDEDWKDKVGDWDTFWISFVGGGGREGYVYKLKHWGQQMNENCYICFGSHHIGSLLSDSLFSFIQSVVSIWLLFGVANKYWAVLSTTCLQQEHKQ